MRDLLIDMADFGGVADPDDAVWLSAPGVRASSVRPSGLVSSAGRTIRLEDGVATVEVEPGPLVVQLKPDGVPIPGGWFRTVIPEGDGTITLRDCLEEVFEHTPEVVSVVAEDRRRAESAALAAERDAESANNASTSASGFAGAAATSAGVAGGHAEATGDDRRQTGEDRQHVDGVKAHVEDASSAAIAAAGIVDNALGAYFEPPSTNLFDHTDVLDGWVLPGGSAVPEANSQHVLSGPIPVQGGEAYAFMNIIRLTWLADGAFISATYNASVGSVRTTTSPATATHVRLTVNKTYMETAQINLGDTLLPYEPGDAGGHVKPGKLPSRLWFDISPEEIGAQPAGDYIEGLVSPEGTTFFDVSTNMVNLIGREVGVVILDGQGAVSANSQFSVTVPIPVTAGEKYTINDVLRVTFFDAGGQYVGSQSESPNAPDTLIAPPAATYARLSVNNSRLTTAQMNAGTALLPYQPFSQPRLGVEYLPDIRHSDLGPITVSDLEFIQMSPNLLDMEALTDNTAIDPTTGHSTPNITQALSDWISVTPGESYTLSPEYPLLNRYAFYDRNRELLSTNNFTTPHTFTADAGAVWMRVNVNRTALGLPLMLNRGATALPHEPYWVEVAGRRVGTTTHSGDELIFMLDTPGLGEIFTAPTIEPQPGLPASSVEDVYSWYDQLVTDHPDYVSRRNLGMSSDGVHPLYAYTFKPEEIANTPSGTINPSRVQPLPTALLMAGIHGYEETAVYSLWRMAQALCTEWDTSPVLDAMRWNFEIIIIPLVNPSGWGPETFGRQNANGVDLARNFAEGWVLGDPSEIVYGGPAPLSEPETQIVEALMEEVAPRCVLGGSFHNFSASAESRNMIWQSGPDPESMLLGKKLVARMSRKWRSEHDWITVPETYFGYSDTDSPRGSEGRAFKSYGILGSSFETSQTCFLDGVGGSARDSRVMTLGYEAVVNYIAMGLLEGLRLKQ